MICRGVNYFAQCGRGVAKLLVGLLAIPRLLSSAALHLGAFAYRRQVGRRIAAVRQVGELLQQQVEPLPHVCVGAAAASGDPEHPLRRRRSGDAGQYPGQRIAAPVVFPPCNQIAGRLLAPLRPVDILPPAQQGADHAVKPLQAELHHQFDHLLVTPGQPVAKLLVEQSVEQRVGLGLVQYAEPRVQPRLDRLRAKQRCTKRVDRADPRRVQLADQIEPVAGLPPLTVHQPQRTGLANPLAHLAGGALGEGDRHQLAQLGTLRFVRCVRLQAGKEPLGQDERLAAARSGREGDGNAPGGNCPTLLVGQSQIGQMPPVGCHVFSNERTWLTRQMVW